MIVSDVVLDELFVGLLYVLQALDQLPAFILKLRCEGYYLVISSVYLLLVVCSHLLYPCLFAGHCLSLCLFNEFFVSVLVLGRSWLNQIAC